MNIVDQLLVEHTKQNTQLIQSYIGTDLSRLDLLMQIFLEGSSLEKQRASWVLKHCFNAQPDLINPYLNKMIAHLEQKGLHDAVVRHTLSILSEHKALNQKHFDGLLNFCFDQLLDQNSAIAIHIYSIELIYQSLKFYPELKNELQIIIEDKLPFASAGFKSRGSKILRKIRS